jgi:L-ascorbate metabolism protein UlaG (beta-lactamase superfamily)
MKRRQLIRYVGMGSIGAIATVGMSPRRSLAQSNSEKVTVQYLGHTCFLFTSDNFKVLVNPFRPAGCTSGYSLPTETVDLVLVSSFLLDEGAIEDLPGNPQVIAQPGDYSVGGMKFQGISTPHDREGGRRFGKNVAWRWTQGGVTIVHLGGAAAPIAREEKIFLSNPDVLFIPVGGGAKAYNPKEAKGAIEILQPKVIVPTQYRTAAADKNNCDLATVDEFLNLTDNMEIKKLNTNRIAIQPSDLPVDKTVIRVFDYS